jgi:hypothetical protein
MRPSTIEFPVCFLVNERPHKERGATRLYRWCQALPYKYMSLWRSHNGMAIVLSFQTSCILAHVLSMMGTGFPSILMEKLMEKRWRPDESVPSSVVAWKSSVLFKQGDDRFLPASIPGPRAVESFRKEGNPWFRQKNRLDFNIASRSFLRKPSLILSVYHWRTNDVPALLPGQ